MQEGERLAIETLPVLGQSAAAVEPGDGAFDDPALRQYGEAMQFVALDHLNDPVTGAGRDLRGFGPLVTGVGVDSRDERKPGPRTLVENKRRTVAVLDIGGVNRGTQQQTKRVYENMPLLALDLFSGIVTMRITPDPPFSALLTLWLSMIAAVGFTSRSSRSRHLT